MAALCKKWAVAAIGLVFFVHVGHCQATNLPSPEDITWTWMKGINTSEQVGAYGTQGVASAENRPGGRYGSVSWRDPSGRMWLFGGFGYDKTGVRGLLNDLWMYDPLTGQWTWIKGGSTYKQPGVYGTQGVADAVNTPGARSGSVSWMDPSGRLWLFGGEGYDETGAQGVLNDLWVYDPLTGRWTWMKGRSLCDYYGTYGTQGVASMENTPGARSGSVSWTDATGQLWLFGGYGFANAAIEKTYLNDLWAYDPMTGRWTWMKGSNIGDQVGVYGTQGVPDAKNTPGSRHSSVSWTDSSGRMWLFGGHAYRYSLSSPSAVLKVLEYINDLWVYDPLTSQWTWIKGSSDVSHQKDVYGTQGVPAVENIPGGRCGSVSWMDAIGRLWLFGGYGFSTMNTSCDLNDLWVYDPLTGQWTWMKGSSTGSQPGIYGTLGVAHPDNTPGVRQDSVSWTDASGRLWLFGGNGLDKGGSKVCLNDLWMFDLLTGQWTWMKGSSIGRQAGVYGVQGVASAENTPGARYDSVSWTDKTGQLWLFGGYGLDRDSFLVYLNDLWVFDPAIGQWTWMKGSSVGNQISISEAEGVASVYNTPSARSGSVSWTDASGRLWLFGGVTYVSGRSKLNDLWVYDPLTDMWIWMNGSCEVDQPAVYGTQGVASAENTPGARYGSASWTDASGRLWLFGGEGVKWRTGLHNDLWVYDPAANHWTWMKGSSEVDQPGVYGTQGVADAANTPSSRRDSVSWTDPLGRLWLFGGSGKDDLWMYDPLTGQWTWMKGSSMSNQPAVYGMQGVADASNTPGSRSGSVSWTDASGRLWLFGGNGPGASIRIGSVIMGAVSTACFNDLWVYNPETNQWTWMKGGSTVGQLGVYGIQGVPDATNTPAARSYSVSWTTPSGQMWLFGGVTSWDIVDDLWLLSLTPDIIEN